MNAQLRPAIVSFLLLTVITGVVYPLAVTGLAQALFPQQANGSLIVHEGQILGSELIGQPFDQAKYLWPRPSATAPAAYNGGASAGSNLGPTNVALIEAVKARVAALRAADPGNTTPIPVDLVTASGSGLDPHISPAAAAYQLPRIAAARGVDETRLREVIAEHTAPAQWGLLGEPRVNVLAVNLGLDRLQ